PPPPPPLSPACSVAAAPAGIGKRPPPVVLLQTGMKGAPPRPHPPSASRVRLRLAGACGVRSPRGAQRACGGDRSTAQTRAPVGSRVARIDHNASIVAGDDLKRAGREGYSHCAPSMFAKGHPNSCAVTSLPHAAVAAQFIRQGHELLSLLTSSGEALIIIRVGTARQPRAHAYS